MHRRCCLLAASPVHYTTSCKHSLVLLRMGEIIARNILSWLKLSMKFVIVASSWLFILLNKMKKVNESHISAFTCAYPIQGNNAITVWRRRPFLGVKRPGRHAEVLTSRAEIRDGPGRDSSVGWATSYGLDGLGIESRWRQVFPQPSRPAVGPPTPLYNGCRVFLGGKAARAWRWPPIP